MAPTKSRGETRRVYRVKIVSIVVKDIFCSERQTITLHDILGRSVSLRWEFQQREGNTTFT